MANHHLQLSIATVLFFFCNSPIAAFLEPQHQAPLQQQEPSTLSPNTSQLPLLSQPSSVSPTLPQPLQQQQQEQQEEQQPSPALPPTLNSPLLIHSQLSPILITLGFQELATAVPFLSDSSFTSWNGPVTLFAPSDDSIRTCPYCSPSRLLKEHMVRGIFSYTYLTKLVSGIKLETMSPGRCITITGASEKNSSKILVDGVPITHPDFYNDGILVIHGLQGNVTSLSPFSCNPTSPEKTSTPPENDNAQIIMHHMLRDAMFRLRENGYSILALALRVKYGELVNLQNMTIFALQDSSIFSGGHSYVERVRFHIVPNRYLMSSDLMGLHTGTLMQTLADGESLVVTNSGISGGALRINYMPLKGLDALHNMKIVVHSIFLPFPHAGSSMFASAAVHGAFPVKVQNASETCDMNSPENKECGGVLVKMEDDGF